MLKDEIKMEETKINYFEKTESPKHREFIISQNNCILCGTVLELRHVSDRNVSEITEEAFCSHCDVKTRARTHILN